MSPADWNMLYVFVNSVVIGIVIGYEMRNIEIKKEKINLDSK